MQLTDYDAEFVGQVTNTGFRRQDGVLTGAQGVMFQCPKCAIGREPGEEGGRHFFRGAHYILCWFKNPQGAARIADDLYPLIARWEMRGTGLHDLVLSPSILIGGTGCGWHGFIGGSSGQSPGQLTE